MPRPMEPDGKRPDFWAWLGRGEDFRRWLWGQNKINNDGKKSNIFWDIHSQELSHQHSESDSCQAGKRWIERIDVRSCGVTDALNLQRDMLSMTINVYVFRSARIISNLWHLNLRQSQRPCWIAISGVSLRYSLNVGITIINHPPNHHR